MNFSSQFDKSLQEKSPVLRGFERLLDPMENGALESLAAKSSAVTRRHFGKTMRLFAPLYLSNECINSCTYCGFSRENAIQRVTLELDQVEAEARHLTTEGFRNILLVAGEHQAEPAPGDPGGALLKSSGQPRGQFPNPGWPDRGSA